MKEGIHMSKSFKGWVLWFLILFILDLFVPFVLLKETPTWLGSFLFWLLWIVVAIFSMFVIFLRWQENESECGTEN